MKNSLTIMSVLSVALFAAGVSAQPENRGKEWFSKADTNKSQTIDAEEFKAAASRNWERLDRNRDGVIDEAEKPRGPRPGQPQPMEPRGDRRPGQPQPMEPRGDRRPGPPGMRPVDGPPIPFFVMEAIRGEGRITRAAFDEVINREFGQIDANNDGVLQLQEVEKRFDEIDARVRRERPRDQFKPLQSSTAKFIGAEMRFGDRLVKDAPFSAEISIEETRRLFDGSTVTKQSKGAVYRDSAGRTRREQPIESIGGYSIVGDDGAPQKLVFINDFVSKTHYFLDPNRKIARRDSLPAGGPTIDQKAPSDARVESLGSKMIEGIKCDGTRTSFDIPVGQLGNEKPIAVVTEKWYSPELQLVVMSRHVDPLSGEHVFRLVNIRRAEPATELFAVPADYKIESMQRRGGLN